MSAFTQMENREQKKRIPQMDMDEVKTLLCPLHGQDPVYCVDCKGIKGCPAGQRAVYLLDEMTGRPDIPKKKRFEFPKNSEAAVEFAKKLSTMEDPVSWMCEQGTTYHAAIERVRMYKKRYPDLMASVELPGRGTSNMLQTPNRLKAAFESGDPITWLLINYHIPKVRGAELVEVAQGMFPELRAYIQKEQPKKEPEEEPVKEEQMEAEISLNDFISAYTYENPVEFTQEAVSESEPDKIPSEEMTALKTENKSQKNISGIQDELEAKLNELNRMEAKARNEMKTLEDKLKWIEESKEALARVAHLFDLSMEIGRLPFTD